MKNTAQKIRVAITDDHKLIRNAMANVIDSFPEYSIIFEADNGVDLFRKLETEGIPEIILMDYRMPEMDGLEATQLLTERYPDIKVVIFSSLAYNELNVILCIRRGAKGFLPKSAEPSELKKALDMVSENGFYVMDSATGKVIISAMHGREGSSKVPDLSERELKFIQLACSEMSYRDIAREMNISYRTVDNYRDSVFVKLGVNSRIALIIFSLRHGLADL